ncbi:MAG: hypothetical protein ACTHU0_03035 [Kofleriaceae bacterium]
MQASDEYFLVLRSDPQDAAFIRDVNQAVEAMVVILRSLFFYEYSEQRSETVVEHYWREQVENGVTVTLIDDLAIGARYLCVAGGDPTQRQRVWKHLAVMLPVASTEELRRAALDPSSTPGLLPQLALSLNGVFEQETADILVGALASPTLDVRMSAAEAALLLRWSQLEPDLRLALDRETDAEGQQALAHVLTVLATSGNTATR